MNFTDEEIISCSATKGDLLVCEGGAGYGRSAIWNYDYDICLQNHVHRLRPYIQGICEYVYYVIYFLKESNKLASVGTAMPGLSANRLKEILIPVPPYKEQQRIVSKLSEIEPYIQKYSPTEVKLETLNISIKSLLMKSILQEAIQGKLVPQDSSDEPASVLLERIKIEKERLIKEKKIKRDKNESIIFKGDDNSYYEKFSDGKVVCIDNEIPFEIPSNWCWVRVDNLFAINPKVVARDNVESAFIPMEKIEPGYDSRFTFEKVKWSEIKKAYTHFADGDVAFAKITPCFQNRKSMILEGLPNGIGAGTT